MGSFSGLLNNSILLLALCVVYDSFGIYAVSNKKLREVITGILVSIITVAVMVNPWILKPGIFFDTRGVILGLSGLFFGVIPTSIAVVVAALLRIFQGGSGTLPGTLVVLSTASVGIAWRYWIQKKQITLNWKQLYVFGLFVHIAFVCCLVTLPASIRFQIIKIVAPPILVIFPFITLFGGIILLKQEIRRQTERELIENRQVLAKERGLLRGVIDTIPDLIYFKDIKGRYIGCNKAFQEYLGKKEKEIQGKFPEEFLHDEISIYATAKDMETMSNEAITRYEACFETKTGKSAIFDTLKTPFKGTDGTLYGLVGISRDITERKQDEIEKIKLQAQLSNALEMAGLGHWEYDIASDLFLLNDYFYKIFRTTAEQTGGYTMSFKKYSQCFIHPDDRYLVETEIQKAIKRTDPSFKYKIEHRMIYANGETGYMSVEFFIVMDIDGKPIKAVGVNQDITERKKMENRLRQAQKMESVGRLAGGVAHDFNNMLSVILGNTELVLDDVDVSSPIVSKLKEIRKAAQRSNDLTRQLLAFARKQAISPKILNLNHTIEGILSMLRRLIGEDIDLSWQPEDSLWPIKIDPSQIDQMLANLCVNARDAIKGVGKVTIETDNIHFDEEYCGVNSGFQPGDYVMISVSDNGCGMDNETVDKLFEPFFTTKQIGQGTGLGMATVYGIVKQNMGFIKVYSDVNQGTTFKIYLPRHMGKSVVHPQKTVPATPLKGNETILLVEDEKAILKMTKMILERLGYNVLAANNPDEAIQLINHSNTQIHLLMTDVVMPSMNGRELSEKIAAIFPKMKCLYMSGYTADVIAHRGILDEGLNFINKPFSKQDLAIKLRDLMDEKDG